MSESVSAIKPKYQPDPESLVDSIAFGPVSKVEAWDKKLQIMKDHTPASCGKARELYKGVASGIQGKRRWKSPSRRMDAAKALMLSDKLQWIPKKCNPKAVKKKKSRTKRHAKSHKMKRKHKQQSKRKRKQQSKRKHKQQSKRKHKQQSKRKSKYTRKMNRKTNNRRKTRRRNIRRTKKRMMGGTPPVNDGGHIRGYLNKANTGWTGSLAPWQRRYIVIIVNDQSPILEYYENGTYKGNFDLKKCSEAKLVEGKKDQFEFNEEGGRRGWFQADSHDEALQWIEAINLAMDNKLWVPGAAAVPAPVAAVAAGAAAPAPADVEAELAAAAAEEVGKAAYKKAAANPKFMFSSPAELTTPHEYMHAIAKQINEDFERLCDDYKTLKSDLNSLLGQFTSVEGQAKSAMENFSSGRYAKMPARGFNSGFMNKDESNMKKIYAWKRENPKFLGLAPSVNGCDDKKSMEKVVEQEKDGTFIDLCMEEIERINKHRFLSRYFGENVKVLHEFGDFAEEDALTVEDVGLFQDMEFRVVCFDILKELDLGSPTPKVEDLINRFKTNKVLITEGGNNDKLRKEVLSRFPDMEKLSGYYGDDYRRKGVESEVAEVVNGPEFNKMVTKLSLLNHLNIIDDGEYELLKNNMSELIAKIDESKIDEAKLAASGSPSSGGF